MKHKLLLYGMSVMVAGVLVWACRHERFGADDPDAVKPTLTVGEAQDFFEWQYAQSLPTMTRASGDRPVGMLPGDFTPLWNKARIGANREMDGADVPIDPHFIFTAVFHRKTETGDTLRQMVDITQKLVVNRWHDHQQWKGMYAYIATLIPTPDYYSHHRNYGQKFVNVGTKADFSGIVIYHTLGGRFVNIDQYRDGVRIDQAYDPEGNLSLAEALFRMLPEAQIYGGTPAMYKLTLESEEVIVQACRQCGMRECYCRESGAGCYCKTIGNEGGGKEEPPVPPGGGGGGNGGGGGGNISPIVRDIPPIQRIDCALSAGENAASVQAMYRVFNNAGLQSFINAHINDNVEWGVALDYDSQTRTYTLGTVRSGSPTSVGIPITYGSYVNSVATFHTHPATGMPHSMTDVRSLMKENQWTNGKTHISIVAVQQEVGVPPIIYALYIEDQAAANTFIGTLNDQFKNQMELEVQDLFTEIYKADQSMDESYAYALSYLLSKYNTGVRILKYENGDFKQQETTIHGNTIIRVTCQ
ncbi:hypothetical protein [uncultured Rikenella sp.]|uniref:hypothetical protein n=1 Tax=uncultured Rikenella sp. TaxID=368003 RepID=UPI00263537ED|nr:hypothetical protein [uncultured Rikenella sp.]